LWVALTILTILRFQAQRAAKIKYSNILLTATVNKVKILFKKYVDLHLSWAFPMHLALYDLDAM
jgi:hypothetical protein